MKDLQWMVLSYVAYGDREPQGDLLERFCKTMQVTPMQVMEAERQLTKKGYMILHENGEREVHSRYKMRVLYWLIREHPEWETLYQQLEIYNRRSVLSVKAFEFAKALFEGLTVDNGQLVNSMPLALMRLCGSIVTEPYFASALMLMEVETFGNFISTLIRWMMANDIDASVSLIEAWKMHPGYKDLLPVQWQDSLLYYYFATGKQYQEASSTWQSEVILGADALISGKKEQAEQHFSQAATMRGEEVVFPDYLSNYLFVQALAAMGERNSQLKLVAIDEQLSYPKTMPELTLHLMAYYQKDNRHRVDDQALSTLNKLTKESMAMGYACLSYLLSVRLKRFREVDVKAMGYQPKLWILSELLRKAEPVKSIQRVEVKQIEKTTGTVVITTVKPTQKPRIELELPSQLVVWINEHKSKKNCWSVQLDRQSGKRIAQLRQRLVEYLQSKRCATLTTEGVYGTFTMKRNELLVLLQFVSQHLADYTVVWRSSAPIRLSELNPSGVQLNLNKREDWLELEGQVILDETLNLSVRDFFSAVLNKEENGFVQVGDKQYVHLETGMKEQVERLAGSFHDNGHRLLAKPLSAAMISDAMTGTVEVAGQEILEGLRAKIQEQMEEEPMVPMELCATLRPYQLAGFIWMSRMADIGAGICLADDMGLGKTLQSITFILSRENEGPALVVAPASVVKNWESEIRRFAPVLHPIVLNMSKDRKKILQEVHCGDVVISTYGLLTSMREEISAQEWGVVCLDEAHTIKNKATQTSEAAMTLKSRHRLALTGTPIQNNLSELWNIFQFLNPGFLGGYEEFARKFVAPIMNNNDLNRQEQLKRLIAPFMMRRTKAEVIKDLPKKQEQTIQVRLREGEMEFYEMIRREAKMKMEEARHTGEKGHIEILAEITKLRMAACSAKLINREWSGACSKINCLNNLLFDILEEADNRVLIFSQFTSFLSMVTNCIDGIEEEYMMLDGSVPIAQRAKLVERFQQGECRVFLISLQAGGLGLNLTAANHVILMDPWWNPAIEQQAIDRTYRIGQQRDVMVHHLIAQNTIEEKIVRLQQTKRDMATALLTGEEMSKGITYDELVELIEN